jgi:hypothetical protein
MIHQFREFESNEPAFFKLLLYSVAYILSHTIVHPLESTKNTLSLQYKNTRIDNLETG